MSKEDWFRNFERLRSNGVSERDACERARHMGRSILDQADEARKREREGSSQPIQIPKEKS